MGIPHGASRGGANDAGMGLGSSALLRGSGWRQSRTRFASCARSCLLYPSQVFFGGGGVGAHQSTDGGYL